MLSSVLFIGGIDGVHFINWKRKRNLIIWKNNAKLLTVFTNICIYILQQFLYNEDDIRTHKEDIFYLKKKIKSP